MNMKLNLVLLFACAIAVVTVVPCCLVVSETPVTGSENSKEDIASTHITNASGAAACHAMARNISLRQFILPGEFKKDEYVRVYIHSDKGDGCTLIGTGWSLGPAGNSSQTKTSCVVEIYVTNEEALMIEQLPSRVFVTGNETNDDLEQDVYERE